ncbi:MAG: hypothetical protein KC445_14655 [Anaerolineales bacterium]|nr:hypothetical protein [Anaerolineales bacterium]
MAVDSSTTPQNWAATLRDLVNRSFDTNEMHELAFDFNLDYDDIPGRGKSAKIVELLQILARQQRIPEFIERCQALRPRENWQPLLAAAQREPLSFAVEMPALETAVSTPQPVAAPTSAPLQNRNLLIGIGALVVIAIVVVVVLLNGRTSSDFANDSALVTKIEAMTSNPKSERQLFFDEGTPGWLLTSNSAVLSEDGLRLGADSVAVRDRTFGPGQAILIDFFLDEVNSTDPVVTFSLQNAQNQADATRIISVQALAQPDSVALENGAEMPANQFSRNTTLVGGQSYTVIMGLDENGRFLASLFAFVGGTTADDAIFTYDLSDWSQDTWWFTIDTGSQGRVTLLGGWDFTLDMVK